MSALPWVYLVLLSIGYALALLYGQLGVLAAISVALLLIAGYAVRQQRTRGRATSATGCSSSWPWAWRCTGCRGSTTGAASHQRFSADAVPFSMYLNQDKPLIGFWLLLACPWIVARRSLRLSICVTALALALTAIAALGGAALLGDHQLGAEVAGAGVAVGAE